MIGIFFMSISFAFTHAIVGKKNISTSTFSQNNDQRLVFLPEGSIGVFFAIVSSVLSCSSWMIVVHKSRKIHLNDFIGSCIGGAVMYGTTSYFSDNISIPIALGFTAGLVCAIYKTVFLFKMNRKNMNDGLGMIGPFLICPILGCYVSTPIILYVYSHYQIVLPQLYQIAIKNISSRYVYIYFILSTALGIVSGMANSSVFRWFKGNETFFGDRLTFLQAVSFR